MSITSAEIRTVTIPAGGGASNTIDLSGLTALELQIPAGSTTADLTAQISHRGTNFGDLWGEDGIAWNVPDVPASTVIRFDERTFQDVKYLKFKLGSQGGAVACTLKVMPTATVLR